MRRRIRVAIDRDRKLVQLTVDGSGISEWLTRGEATELANDLTDAVDEIDGRDGHVRTGGPQ